MGVKISIVEKGETGKVLVDVGDIKNKFDKGIRDTFFDQGDKNVKYTRKEILKRNKSGRLYKIKGRLHRASAPGEYPANLSGKLRKGIGYKVRGSNSMEFGSKEDYSKYLELGTKNMDPREFIGRTVKEKAMDFRNALEYNVDKRVKGDK